MKAARKVNELKARELLEIAHARAALEPVKTIAARLEVSPETVRRYLRGFLPRRYEHLRRDR